MILTLIHILRMIPPVIKAHVSQHGLTESGFRMKGYFAWSTNISEKQILARLMNIWVHSNVKIAS